MKIGLTKEKIEFLKEVVMVEIDSCRDPFLIELKEINKDTLDDAKRLLRGIEAYLELCKLAPNTEEGKE